MGSEISDRIKRIYSAIGAIEEHDANKLKAKIVETEEFKGVFQDFRGALTDADLWNLAHMLIDNIAKLRDHLRKWAERNGKDKRKVDEAIASSLALQIILDLSNNDKHGYPPRNGGHSRRSPRLAHVKRVMQLRTRAQKGSIIGMRLGADGKPEVFGDGRAAAVVSGEVVDKENVQLGDLYGIARKGVQAWEKLLRDFRASSDVGDT
ncbi:MAG: hypothetical protein JSV16_00545 [Candidatus Hydrogenedentota bacterium]|nr:MAG: hypothetical protein JSV16_00545 [Candidatus Hydrogenedentota bacterium]